MTLKSALHDRTTLCGIILLGIGISVSALGLLALLNYSQVCYVNPGGFPCQAQYQVALLAPLYPLSNWLIATGALLTAIASIFAIVGYQEFSKKATQSPKPKPI